ncbi:Repeat domain-containing protein [Halogranum rubrum]|uniref:Repeat domain-containing protein n=1 Tax=Halogranum rubrum TaxID=553466 RepID=A0A1I4BQ62_9EURY|nr:VCBS repeat-containing protein [Halogranum rubrum]SFK70972.1 Repeat domain-containing protein [Halogranum rubrum]
MATRQQQNAGLTFRHECIDPEPPCSRLGFCLTTDLTGNGRDDIIIGGAGKPYPGKNFVLKAKESNFPTFDRLRTRLGLEEMHLFWYENPGWKRHKMAIAPHLDVGGALGDINGDGRLDVVAGQGINHNAVYWFEQPKNPRKLWKRHTITTAFEKYHDVIVRDVDDDGELEVVGLSQESRTIFYYDIPEDPYQAPWPDSHCHIVDDDVRVEGVEIVDIDGDGKTEILAGTHIYHRNDDGSWDREDVVTDWDDVRLAVGDLDDDGELEIVYSEGDSPEYGGRPGRVAWVDGPDWTPTILREEMFCPHTLQLADFTGSGRLDIYVGEMALTDNKEPKHLIFENLGDGQFEEHLVESGIATHEGKVADLTGNGKRDIVGKSYGPNHHIDVWYNEG